MTQETKRRRFQLDELKLAFVYHVIEEIIDADRHIDLSELAFITRRFPAAFLESCEFIAEGGARTSRYHEAVDEAMIELPERLTVSEKLEFLELFTGAAAVDSVFRHVEGDVLQLAAEHLELGTTEWRRLVEDSL